MAANALIFDLDGTVWDSAGWFATALSDDIAGVAAIERDLRRGGNIVGALKTAGIGRERLIRTAISRAGPPPLFPGMRDAISTLRDRGTPMAVATSLPGSIASPMLDAAGLAGSFDVVIHAGLCRVAKPNPASINMALRHLGRAASSAIFYVGDRAGDAAAAERAGISAVWMRHGYEQPGEDSSAKLIDPAELLDL